RGDETVRLPLAAWRAHEAELQQLRDGAARADADRRVIIGETRYRGRSDGRNLRLVLTLRAQLADSAATKSVEVVGTDAVLVSATHEGRAVSLARVDDRWVWLTAARGHVELEVELVIPPRGPRGSIEYRFGVVESPVTELEAFFVEAQLSPRVTGAVTSSVEPSAGGTKLRAILGPTRELHVVGFHDVDARDARPAKLYAETESLVSLSDDSVELFSVVGVTILYAPAKRFRIALPAGFDLVSADGQGAFQYAIEDDAVHGRVLVGETAFGIERHYEISLRLQRSLAPSDTALPLPLPRLLDVERDSGFVALEVPGKLSIAGVDGEGLVGIDVRELPQTILKSSVSPVVRAFRYTGDVRTATVTVARHPEKPLAAGGVDVLRATSVLTSDGRVMTDLLFTIRNNLQQYLALELADGAEVKSAVLEGDPIKPSRDRDGRILVPLRRSRSTGSGLAPFRVQLVYEQSIDDLGLAGRRALALPKVLAPIASVDWSVFAPGPFDVHLASPVGPETFVKNAQWHRGADGSFDEGDALAEGEEGTLGASDGAIEEDADGEGMIEGEGVIEGEGAIEGVDAAVHGEARASGVMPVRVQLPRDGQRLGLQRFWIGAGDVVTAELWYLRAPLGLALELAAALAVLVALAIVAHRRRWLARVPSPRPWIEAQAVALWVTARAGFASIGEAFEALRPSGLVVALAAMGVRFAAIATKLVILAIVVVALVFQVRTLLALLANPL
ncbi:hypothetical protein L6R52_27210, partial [Myxococcota bacterium]|nr:hypothetical protein [Myxococcota bacterium]